MRTKAMRLATSGSQLVTPNEANGFQDCEPVSARINIIMTKMELRGVVPHPSSCCSSYPSRTDET